MGIMVAAPPPQVKAALIRRLVKVSLALVPATVVVGVVGSMYATTLLMASTQGDAAAAAGSSSNGCQATTTGSSSGVLALLGGTSAGPLGWGLDGKSHTDQAQNISTIIAVAKKDKAPAQAVLVSVMATMTETRLIDAPYGDRDSLGNWQMRATWGTREQRLDVAWGAHKFYTVLTQVPGWLLMNAGAAAQSVEVSAFPDRYAKNEALARRILADPAAGSATCTGTNGFSNDGSTGAKVYAAALRFVGTPYVWGGGAASGPTTGLSGSTVGFDCSGLALYAWSQVGMTLPRVTDAQAAATPHLPAGTKLLAGDLMFFHIAGDASALGHVGISDGAGGMIHAPTTGQDVQVVRDVMKSPYWSAAFALATRP